MVLRILVPLLMAAVALYVGNYNASHTDSVLLFPMTDLIFPATTGDLPAQGQSTVLILWVLCGFSVVWSIVDTIRVALRRRRAAPQADAD